MKLKKVDGKLFKEEKINGRTNLAEYRESDGWNDILKESSRMSDLLCKFGSLYNKEILPDLRDCQKNIELISLAFGGKLK